MTKEWICENCGRRVSIAQTSPTMSPSAKCRIPEKFIKSEDKSYISRVLHDPLYGVGTELSNILKKIHISCHDVDFLFSSKIKLLNKNGISWCSDNINLIIEWMANEAKNKNIIFIHKMAKAIIKLSIKKAKLNRLHTDNTLGLNQQRH
jgi:hypothetical protein